MSVSPSRRPQEECFLAPGRSLLSDDEAETEAGAAKALEDLKGKRRATGHSPAFPLPQHVCFGPVQETTTRKLDLLKSGFAEMRALIEAVENDAVREEERVLGKFDVIHQTITRRKKAVQNLKDQIELVLEKPAEFFLEKAAKLHDVSTKDVYVPEIDLNQEMIQALYHSSFSLKEVLKQNIKDLHEKRSFSGKSTGERFPEVHVSGFIDARGVDGTGREGTRKRRTRLHPPDLKRAGRPPVGGCRSPVSFSALCSGRRLCQGHPLSRDRIRGSLPRGRHRGPDPGRSSWSRRREGGLGPAEPLPPSSLPAPVEGDRLTWGLRRGPRLPDATKVTFDFNAAHPEAVLSDAAQPCRPHPRRFTYRTQVPGRRCCESGVHRWEVEPRPDDLCGVDICYGSTDRRGAGGRPGRNAVSRCVERFDGKLSARPADAETSLPGPESPRVGVLLRYDAAFVVFLSVSDKISLLYMFEVDFSEAVLASGTSLALSPHQVAAREGCPFPRADIGGHWNARRTGGCCRRSGSLRCPARCGQPLNIDGGVEIWECLSKARGAVLSLEACWCWVGSYFGSCWRGGDLLGMWSV
ncbi:E3 ubiquitin/ISG15 ligase TRIM25 [Ornithorhynchus anatinus]|uniref:E3 ubiquitin/ISG15 ligase TRIM25 n=1 Tax=Ornithorhynchus anatinus TaxID=9258 RepID=UPI0019D49DF3|nr:E3 ubiquitin/ISG15 ligase TRIM25 [Ornithorhynchus anatinus]